MTDEFKDESGTGMIMELQEKKESNGVEREGIKIS